MVLAPGYSGIPLAKKLGYKPASRAALIDVPKDYLALVEPLPPDVVFERTATAQTDLVHVFVTERDPLARQLSALRKKLRPDAAVWVCAVTEVWSGLKLVVRKQLRNERERE